jgi:hypothetical protein
LPARQARRHLLLDKIAQAFEPGVRYSERRVSLFLGALHADYAALRRSISSTRSSCPAPKACTGAAAVLCFRPRRMSSGLKHSQPGRDGRSADSQRGGPYSMCQQPANAAAGNLAQIIHSGVARNAAHASGAWRQNGGSACGYQAETSPSSALMPPNSVGDRSPNPNNYAALRSIRNARSCRKERASERAGPVPEGETFVRRLGPPTLTSGSVTRPHRHWYRSERQMASRCVTARVGQNARRAAAMYCQRP